MPIQRTSVACAAIVATGAVAISACSAIENGETSSSAGATTETSVAAPRTEPTAPAPTPPPENNAILPTGDVSLGIDDRGDLNQILVDGSGRTLYAFSKDRPNEPTCYGECADTWLPVLDDGDPAGTIGIEVAAVQTVPRRDGGNQVTYKGIPLYRYAGDQVDRDAKGQGRDMFGGEWHVLTKDGVPLE